ncbi:MAG: fold metallo-hydrolase, partial [Herminiimonas sp.]|nr:fold metallo-hydrolase [Herminiimonas sp.]
FTKAELDRWDDRQPGFVTRPINQFVFADSILPVIEAGQVVLVEDGHCVDDALTVEAAPGHTCGHVKIRVKSGEREGMFTGDTIHHPIQLPYPKLCSTFDEDPVQAMHTRLAMLEECASRNILLLPTHFADPFSCWIEAKGTAGPSYRAIWNHG